MAKTQQPPLSEEGRLKMKSFQYDLLKFILGSVVIGAAGIISTAVFKHYELKISARNSENSYMKEYITQYTSLDRGDTAGKYEGIVEMFQVLSIATTDDEMRQKWDSVCEYFQRKDHFLRDSLTRLTRKIDTTQSILVKKQEEKAAVDSAIKHIKQENVASTELKQLEDRQATLQQTISESEKRLTELAETKLQTDIYANKRLVTPPTVLAKVEKNYEIIYDLERFAAIKYYNDIIEGFAVHVEGYDESTHTVSMKVDRNDKNEQSLKLKAGGSETLHFDNGKYSVTLTLISYERRKALGKKVATYRIAVSRRKD